MTSLSHHGTERLHLCTIQGGISKELFVLLQKHEFESKEADLSKGGCLCRKRRDVSVCIGLSISVSLLCDSVSPLCTSLSFCLHVCVSLHFSFCFSASVISVSVCFCFSYVCLCFPACLYFSISVFLCLCVIPRLSSVRKRLPWLCGHMLGGNVITVSCSQDSMWYRATGEPQFSRPNSVSEAHRGGREGREMTENFFSD